MMFVFYEILTMDDQELTIDFNDNKSEGFRRYVISYEPILNINTNIRIVHINTIVKVEWFLRLIKIMVLNNTAYKIFYLEIVLWLFF